MARMNRRRSVIEGGDKKATAPVAAPKSVASSLFAPAGGAAADGSDSDGGGAPTSRALVPAPKWGGDSDSDSDASDGDWNSD